MEVKMIKVAISEKVVETKLVEFVFPQEAKYYKFIDDGRFFARGEVLFAIIPKYKNSTLLLIEVERGKQNYDDFVPTNDCRQSYWIKGSHIRNKAWDIMNTPHNDGFFEISKEEFDRTRSELLDCYKEYESNTK